MRDSQKRLAGKSKHLFGLLMLLFIAVIGAAFSMTGSDDFDFAKKEVLLRRIGHEILLFFRINLAFVKSQKNM